LFVVFTNSSLEAEAKLIASRTTFTPISYYLLKTS